MLHYILLTGNIFIVLYALNTLWVVANEDTISTKFTHAFIMACVLLVGIMAVKESYSLSHHIIGDQE